MQQQIQLMVPDVLVKLINQLKTTAAPEPELAQLRYARRPKSDEATTA